MKKSTPRRIAVEILNRIEENGAYAEPLLDAALSGAALAIPPTGAFSPSLSTARSGCGAAWTGSSDNSTGGMTAALETDGPEHPPDGPLPAPISPTGSPPSPRSTRPWASPGILLRPLQGW